MTNNVPPQFNGNKVSSKETVSPESGKLINLQLQKESDRDRQNSKKPKVGFKTLVKVLAISIIPLAVLAIEVSTYYHASQSFKQIDDRESNEPKQLELLIPILLMGVGATVSGALAALWINRILNSTKTNKKTTQEAKIRQELTEQIQLLTKATEKIRNSLTQEDLFQTAVQEARKAISADRVVVYSLDEQSQGKIMAESVDYLYPQALGAIIDDPCFSIHYLEKYQNGRVKATDDIYQANLTACHLAQLEPFAVKANLVTPILNQGKLIGLLIAHHCAAPHAWQQSEIDVMTQIAAQMGLALDNIKLLTTSADLRQQQEIETRRIQSLTKATDNIRASLNQEDIFQTAVQEARQA
ncbi:MAG: GAF domain-containing protein, partial [Xenococcaceae cyanobacterium]